jgi:hypothetical protein
MGRRLIACAVALATLLFAAAARAEHRRVALVNGNDVLERQVRIALSSWELDVERVDWTSMGAAMPAAADEARRVAKAHHVDAVVWISENGAGHALWIFDVDQAHAVSRPLSSATPTDTAEAAALALTLKTLLRSTTAAPPAERIGAGAERPMSPIGVFRLEAEGGGAFATKHGAPELRFGLTALWWPRFLSRRAGLAIGVWAGPGLTIQRDDEFSGHFVDVALAPAFRFNVPLGGRFAVEPSAGASFHLTHLDGAAVRVNRGVSHTEVDTGIDASALLSVALFGGVGVGVRVSGTYLLAYQRYEVQGNRVLELSPLQGTATLVLSARLN